ncbi:DUF4276 family protein [Caballeronia novacaledonica]|uniref:DUF4276 family protein n=1 Tax=Caballeronia novacaledonica TaxID=1544861 RepID=UPI001EE20F4B|nr:DUF4276 family protein [Caballeronia novacaledonica]
MIEVTIVCEGQTEETFVRAVLQEPLALAGVFVSARLINTSSSQRGGALNLDRVSRFIRDTLMQRADTYVSTFFDLYGLDASFGGVLQSRGQEPSKRATQVERELHEHIVGLAACRAERFVPHIQPHEFEALLFSDIDQLCSSEPEWLAHHEEFAVACAQAGGPEWINDSPYTAPSKRLDRLSPRYRKTQHGPDIALRIGLATICEQCPHFGQWYDRLLALPPL